MIFETSWDDHCVENKRLADLLFKYAIPGTFYIEAEKLNDWKTRDQVFQLRNRFEIGCHSYTHPADMKTLSFPQLYYQTKTAKDDMERIIGRVNKFCYPRGRYNDEVIKAVREAGFTEARTTQVEFVEYDSSDPFRKPTTIHFYPRKEYGGLDLLDHSKKLFDHAQSIDGYFHLWGHGWEIEKLGLWKELEDLLLYISERITTSGKISVDGNREGSGATTLEDPYSEPS